MSRLLTLLCTALTAFPVMAGEPARRETSLRFEVDAEFQSEGGLQFFYELAKDSPSPEKASASFKALRPFDSADRWSALSSPTHVLMSRLIYSVDRDVSTFSRELASDLIYINTVAPEAKVTLEADGSFRAHQTPENTFRITYLDAAQVSSEAQSPLIVRLRELSGEPSLPESVVIQENTDFARVLGMRTAEFSTTVTGHYGVAPGKTRVHVFTLSYLHTLPPFFLGGDNRVYRESLSATLKLVHNLRAWKPAAPVIKKP